MLGCKGVRRCLFPVVFNIYGEGVIGEALSNLDEGVKVNDAGDMALLFKTQEGLQRLVKN